MSELGAVHFAFAIAAMISGGVVCLRRKGTRWHRTIGHVYATSMLALNGTALGLYRLTGNFGPFHVGAILSLLTVGAGVAAALTRRPRGKWVEAHAQWMSWSYVALLAAFVSETLTRVAMPFFARDANSPATPIFWVLVGLSTAAVIGAGAWIIRRRMSGALNAV